MAQGVGLGGVGHRSRWVQGIGLDGVMCRSRWGGV